MKAPKLLSGHKCAESLVTFSGTPLLYYCQLPSSAVQSSADLVLWFMMKQFPGTRRFSLAANLIRPSFHRSHWRTHWCRTAIEAVCSEAGSTALGETHLLFTPSALSLPTTKPPHRAISQTSDFFVFPAVQPYSLSRRSPEEQ